MRLGEYKTVRSRKLREAPDLCCHLKWAEVNCKMAKADFSRT